MYVFLSAMDFDRAQTVIEQGFALPHAFINWGGDFRVVLGRSRTGVEFGINLVFDGKAMAIPTGHIM